MRNDNEEVFEEISEREELENIIADAEARLEELDDMELNNVSRR